MERPRSVMDLGILFQVLKDRGLKYRIGNIQTPGDGNCYLSMMMMNILHFQEAGRWTGRVPTDVDELRACIGLDYYRGLMGLSKQKVSRLWGKDGPNVFAATMSRDRYQFLKSNISFDDKGVIFLD